MLSFKGHFLRYFTSKIFFGKGRGVSFNGDVERGKLLLIFRLYNVRNYKLDEQANQDKTVIVLL